MLFAPFLRKQKNVNFYLFSFFLLFSFAGSKLFRHHPFSYLQKRAGSFQIRLFFKTNQNFSGFTRTEGPIVLER